MSLLFTLAAFVVTLGILIVVHEFGHFLVARLCGVKVLCFSVGFGKKLVSRRFAGGETEWVLAAFPLGGYVKMLDEHEGPVAPEELGRAFNRQSVWRRSLIVLAGPMANLLLAVFLYWFLFMVGVHGLSPVLGKIPPATPAASAAFQPGETIVSIAGEQVPTWQDARWALLKQVGSKRVQVETRNERGETVSHSLDLEALTPDDMNENFLGKVGLTAYQPEFPARIGRLLPESVAARAGLKVGDEVVSVNQAPIGQWEELVRLVRLNPGKTLELAIKRGGATFSIELVPAASREKNGAVVGKIGASPMVDQALLQRLIVEVRYPPYRALVQALVKTWDTSVFSVTMLAKMVVGEVSWRNISGPVTIADYAGQSAHMGWLPFLSFLALISISLGVLNLMPVPLLDGGHLMYYMAEIVKGSPVSERTMEIGQQIGIAILLIMVSFAFYNDINRLIAG